MFVRRLIHNPRLIKLVHHQRRTMTTKTTTTSSRWEYALLGTFTAVSIASGITLYEQRRSIYAAYTMYQIAQLYGHFNSKYREQMQQVMKRKYGDDDDGQKQQQSDTTNDQLLQESNDLAFIELYTQERKIVHQQAADLLLELCRVNKGAYVKAAQYLASMNPMLPREYTETLSVLQDRAPTHTYEETVQIFMKELGVHPEAVFDKFETDPIASASIAQVHVAYLKNTGEKVAVKIQHPNLEQTFKTDLQAMKWIMFAYKLKNKFSLDWLLPRFESVLLSELDFINEGKNCERLRDMFSDANDVVVPQLYWDKTTKRVLVMEYMDGCKITDLESIRKMGFTEQQVAKLLIGSFSRMTFEHGFIHSDLHAGNILIRKSPKNNTPQIVYLDHGCYEELTEKTRLDYSKLWKAMVFRQYDDMEYYTKELGIDPEFYLLFAMFLTATNMFDQSQKGILDNRRQKVMGKADWKNLTKRIREKYLVNGRSTVEDIVEEMIDQNSTNRSLVLLLRANAQVRNLHYLLGAPINRFGVMAMSCLTAVHYDMREQQKTIYNDISIPVRRRRSRPILEELSLKFQILELKLSLFIVNTLLWIARNINILS
jgi:aarF domain-containing kinase